MHYDCLRVLTERQLMTDDESALPAAGRQRQLEEERTRLRGRIETLSASSPDAGPDPARAGEVAELEQRLEDIEQELGRIILAAEMERQEDA